MSLEHHLQITIPSNLQSTTLHALKDLINNSPLGPVDRSEQRLFHLGKEMKGNNSNLEGLGIGNFNVFSIHLHSTRPKVNELLESDEEEDDDVIEVVDVTERDSRGGGRNNNRKREDAVVDLLDSDSDDDIEVVQVTGNKRRRKNEITID